MIEAKKRLRELRSIEIKIATHKLSITIKSSLDKTVFVC